MLDELEHLWGRKLSLVYTFLLGELVRAIVIIYLQRKIRVSRYFQNLH